MEFKIVDPVNYLDWDDLLIRNGDHNYFHSSSWAKVLEYTYGHRAVYHAILGESGIQALVPLMEIRSVLFGKRGVSLPYTDHCPPFQSKDGNVSILLTKTIEYGVRCGWKYIEWRDGKHFHADVAPWELYDVHEVDLDRSEAEIYSTLEASNRRNIRNSMRQGVSIHFSWSMSSFQRFCQLHLLTRKRHGLPIQPQAFFNNLFAHAISQNRGVVALALHHNRAIAGALFLYYGNTALFKFGASDKRYQHLRPNNLLMWEAIRWFKWQRYSVLNLGRSEITNAGLLRYKRAWGAKERKIKYCRLDFLKGIYLSKKSDRNIVFRRALSKLPVRVLQLIGSLSYRHFG
jgi:hypothetical protein